MDYIGSIFFFYWFSIHRAEAAADKPDCIENHAVRAWCSERKDACDWVKGVWRVMGGMTEGGDLSSAESITTKCFKTFFNRLMLFWIGLVSFKSYHF